MPQTKVFGKICIKIIRGTFSSICGLWSGEIRGNTIFKWSWYPTEGESSDLLACRETPYLISSLSGTSWSHHKENHDEGAWSTYCNDFQKGESIFFQSNKVTVCNVKDGKEVISR